MTLDTRHPIPALHAHSGIAEFANSAILLIAFCCCAVAEEAAPPRNYLQDPGFETGAAVWQKVFPEDQAATVALALDRQVKRSGEGSVSVADTAGKVWAFHNWTQHLEEFPKGKWAELSAWVKPEDVRYSAQLALQCWDGAAKKTVGWASTADREKIRGTGDWERHAVRLFVPPTTTMMWVRLGLTGAGKVWFDDVAVTAADGPLPLASLQIAPGGDALLNGGFEEQHPGLLTHWIPYTPQSQGNKVELTRDAMIFHSGKAAARIMNRDWMNRELNHWGQMVAPAPIGRRVRLEGWVKTQSVEGEVGFLVQCFDGPMHALPRLLAEVSSLQTQKPQGDTDWTKVSTGLSVPPGTMQLWVRAFLKGPGTAWFDDVQLVVE
ncbi:MAG: hypothetical protein GW802_16195 [Armatimonadetes bacterium]|nr:hypothetical protein [Armatimonadota bacterium]